MIGKKLFNLIQELDTSERKLIFSQAKRSDDKRYSYLKKLLGTKRQSVLVFQQNLIQIQSVILPGNSNVAEVGLATRRLIDFCIKEIENIKIKQYINTNKKIRSYLLCEVYKDYEKKEILEDYLSKLIDAIDVDQDYWLYDFYLKTLSNLKLRTQTKRDIKDWKGLLLLQKDYTQKFYVKKNAIILDKVSSLYLDDKGSVDAFKAQITDEKTSLALIASTHDKQTKAIIYGALAQFNFENKLKYQKYSELSFLSLKGEKGLSSDFIKRKLLLVNFLHTFHFGQPAKKVLSAISAVVKIDRQYSVNDQRNIFFLFLVQLVFNDRTGEINYFKVEVKKYLNLHDAEYFHSFLLALDHFINNKYKLAKRILVEISHTKNNYIATWARLIEIVINIKQENFELAENYLLNEVRRIISTKNKTFTTNSSAYLLVQMASILSVKVPKALQSMASPKKLVSPFHYLLSNTLLNK